MVHETKQNFKQFRSNLIFQKPVTIHQHVTLTRFDACVQVHDINFNLRSNKSSLHYESFHRRLTSETINFEILIRLYFAINYRQRVIRIKNTVRAT